MANRYYYTNPTVCKYYIDGQYQFGIVDEIKIIDLNTGKRLSLDDIYDAAIENHVDEDDVIIEYDWAKLSLLF